MAATILVLEDDAVLRELLSEVLSDEGYHVVAAPTLARLLTLLPHTADLLIADLLIALEPVGLEAIERVRSVMHRNLPAIVCTGATKQIAQLHPEIKRLQAQVLPKPFTVDELLDQVARALGERYVLHLPQFEPVYV